MTRNSDAKFEEKLTCCLENDMRNLAKLVLSWDSFVQNRKCMNLKATEELCAMAIKNDTKIEEELTCRFKIDMRNLTNFTRALESLQNLHLKWSPSDQRI